MKVKRNKLDDLFSKLVRERDNWTCVECGRYFPDEPYVRGGLECSHIWGRGKWSVRFDPKNAVSHCTGCHAHFGAHPILFARWAEAYLGPREFAELEVRAHRIKRWTKPMKEDLYQDMKAAYEHMLSRRKSGETGRLEFEL